MKHHNSKGATQKLKEEEREERHVVEALKRAQALLESARRDGAKHLLKTAVSGFSGPVLANSTSESLKFNQTMVELARLERHARELQGKRESMRRKHDFLKGLIKLEEKRRKLLAEENKHISKEKSLQKHVRNLQAKAKGLVKAEERLLEEFQKSLEAGDKAGAKKESWKDCEGRNWIEEAI